jgi:hypothetical protein
MRPHARYAALAAALLCLPAAAQTADFDTLGEGTFAPTIVDGGITFSDFDNGIGGTNFVLEQADATLTGQPGFTAPMTLGFGGWSPGPSAAFSRVVSFEFTSGSAATSAALELWELGSTGGNTVTLEALAGTSVVATDSVVLPGGFSIHHFTLSVSGPTFDRLRVAGAGADGGAFFAVVDHVVVGGEGPATSSCPGDGSQSVPCPCANAGDAGHGCDNSAGTGGSELEAQGTTTPDTVVLTATGELPTALSIFLQGDQVLPQPTVFGDGLRCVGGNLKRLYVENAVAGTVSEPDPGDPSITARSAALGDAIAPGATRHYQVYYRDPDLAFCPSPPGNSWNASNALSITW